MRRFYPSKQSSNFQLVTGILDYHVDISKSFSHSNARSSERRAHQGYRNLKSTEQHHPIDVRVRALVPLLSPLPSLSLCGINHYTGPRNVNLRRINTDKYETVQQSRKGGGIKGTQQAEECAPSTTKLERQRTFSSPRRYLFSACAESCRDVVDARGRRR